MRHSIKRATRFAAIAIISLPLFTSGATVAELQAQVAALLQQVTALQAQINAQSAGAQGGSGTGAATPVNTSACPNIGRVLQSGTSGDDVTRLQQFLARDAGVYPEALVTGYYGSLTVSAVQRWQTKYNIVSSGTPATTGYGVVGPRTAAAIALLCATGGGGSASQGPVGGYIQVSPISGNSPLTVSVQATVNTTKSCGSAAYTLDYGDGSPSQLITVPAGNCGQMQQTYSHTYIYGGTYQITLSAGTHKTHATVVVYGLGGPAQTPATPVQSTANQTFVVSPTTGAAPLTVTFSGIVTGASQGWCAGGCSSTIVFGDGATGSVPLPASQSGSQAYTIQHTYTLGGTYTAVMYQGQTGSGKPTVGNPVTITVSGNTQLPPFSLTPNVSGNPLAISVQFEYALCQGYTIDWGDTKSDVGQSACGTAPTATKTLAHTYTTPGSYTVKLTRGSQIDTASIVIQN